MIVMAQERFKAAMADLFDSSGLPDVRDVWKQELKCSCGFKYPWVKRFYDEVATLEGFARMRWNRMDTGFGSHRSALNELGKVSLSNIERGWKK